MDFESVCSRLEPAINRLADGSASWNRGSDRDDLLQDLRLKLWEDIREGRYREKNDGYILQGLRFHARNLMRKEATYRRYSSVGRETFNDHYPTDSHDRGQTSGSDEIEARASFSLLMGRIKDDRARKVLTLLGQGLNLREIGDRLNLSHVRVYQIRKRLFGFLQGLGEEV
ncbi:hypothetical protein ACFLT7_00170 [candidate division KSB1 bacterium]